MSTRLRVLLGICGIMAAVTLYVGGPVLFLAKHNLRRQLEAYDREHREDVARLTLTRWGEWLTQADRDRFEAELAALRQRHQPSIESDDEARGSALTTHQAIVMSILATARGRGAPVLEADQLLLEQIAVRFRDGIDHPLYLLKNADRKGIVQIREDCETARQRYESTLQEYQAGTPAAALIQRFSPHAVLIPGTSS